MALPAALTGPAIQEPHLHTKQAIHQDETTNTDLVTVHDHTLPPKLPPRSDRVEDEPTYLAQYVRDPHRLVGYLVPFPKPQLANIPPDAIPNRFLIYTPPPPPLRAPDEGDTEPKLHKLQRKWEQQVKAAKTSDAKTMTWTGLKSKATRGINTAMGYTKSSSLEFITRLDPPNDATALPPRSPTFAQTEPAASEPEQLTTHKTLGLEAITLVYPPSLMGTDQARLRQDFINTMLRTKSKAQRDTLIASGLLPIAAAIDILGGPISGFLEVDAVWLYASARGVKISRNITKRLTSSTTSDDQDRTPGPDDKDALRLEFAPSDRLHVLAKYLAARCRDKNRALFPSVGVQPTESDVLQAIGWAPTQTGGETRNWEDEQWETSEVKDDLESIMSKAAREWDKWVQLYAKNPEKAHSK